ncbi:unnamed protein product [Musa acuminata var. zebrina]
MASPTTATSSSSRPGIRVFVFTTPGRTFSRGSSCMLAPSSIAASTMIQQGSAPVPIIRLEAMGRLQREVATVMLTFGMATIRKDFISIQNTQQALLHYLSAETAICLP